MRDKYLRFYLVTLIVSLVIILSGCSSNDSSQLNSKDSVEEKVIVDDKESKLELQSLKLENEKLRLKLKELEEMQSVTEGEPEWFSEYPHLEPLTVSQQWDSIELSSEYGEVVITDPGLIDYASWSWMFVLTPSPETFPGGHYPYNIEPFSIHLTNSTGSYQLDTSAQNYITSPDVDYYVFNVSSEVAQFGKAFLPRPPYLPEESIESRMLNSGGMIVSMSEDSYYYDFYQSKQRSIVKMFLESEKTLIAEDDVQNSEFVIDIIFLLYGEQVLMRVFEDYILIADHNSDMYWYATDLAPMITGIIHAG